MCLGEVIEGNCFFCFEEKHILRTEIVVIIFHEYKICYNLEAVKLIGTHNRSIGQCP
jgi:hypothetical protein